MLVRHIPLFTIALLSLLGAARGGDYNRVLVRTLPDGSQDTCYLSARNVYVDALVDHQWVDRYWGANAQLPISYERRSDIEAFRVAIDGHDLAANWNLVTQRTLSAAGDGAIHYVVELLHGDRRIRVRLHTEVDGTSVLKRWLEITNESAEPVSLTRLAIWPSWMQAQKHYGGDESPPRRIDHAFDLGYYARGWHSWEGWFTWEALKPGVRTVGCDLGQWYNSPFFMLRNNFTGEYLIGALGWSANWRLEVEAISGRVSDEMRFSIEPATQRSRPSEDFASSTTSATHACQR